MTDEAQTAAKRAAQNAAFARWYAKNADKLNARRKHRYDNDPAYRKRCLAQRRRHGTNERARIKELKAAGIW